MQSAGQIIFFYTHGQLLSIYIHSVYPLGMTGSTEEHPGGTPPLPLVITLEIMALNYSYLETEHKGRGIHSFA